MCTCSYDCQCVRTQLASRAANRVVSSKAWQGAQHSLSEACQASLSKALHLSQVTATPTRLPCHPRWLINIYVYVWHQSRRGFICIDSGLCRRCSAHEQRLQFSITQGAVVGFHRQTMLSSTQRSSTHCVCSAGGEHAWRCFTLQAVLLCQSPRGGDLERKGLQPSVRLDPAVLGRNTMALPGGGHPVRLLHVSSQAGTPAPVMCHTNLTVTPPFI